MSFLRWSSTWRWCWGIFERRIWLQTSDFEEMDMDSLIREQIHKFARIFIGKKLSLEYQEVSETVLTDEKWLGFVLGQILSNALKYTKKGKKYPSI